MISISVRAIAAPLILTCRFALSFLCDGSEFEMIQLQHRNLVVTAFAALLLLLVPALPAQQSATDRTISVLETRASVAPGDCSILTCLGEVYIQKGRETADGSYFQLAERALRKSLDLATDEMKSVEPLTQLAVVAMAEHRFRDALAQAQHAAAIGSGDLTPYGIIGDAYADMGQYEDAMGAYSRMREPAGSARSAAALGCMRDSRISYLKFIHGDTPGAIKMMQGALAAAIAERMPRENVAWSEYQLGEYFFQAGDLAGAEKAYSEGLEYYPNYYRDLAGLAKVRAAECRFDDAVKFYQAALNVVPFPDYAAALGDVYSKLGRPAQTRQQYDLVEFMAHLNTVNKVLYNRELAVYYADHEINLPQALELARKELEVRQDVYTWDALAWSLYKNHQSEQAVEAMRKALAAGTQDAALFFHAGMIHRRLGDEAKAQQYFSRALTLNPRFHVLYGDVAERLLHGSVPNRAAGSTRRPVPKKTQKS
jgi:tetratricopeptide (TPR) repeat protein